jgi:hypothetical protein
MDDGRVPAGTTVIIQQRRLSSRGARVHNRRMSSPAMAEPRRLSCTRCGAAFECGSTVGKCWCAEEDFRLPMPSEESTEDCLCQACLRQTAAIARPSPA